MDILPHHMKVDGSFWIDRNVHVFLLKQNADLQDCTDTLHHMKMDDIASGLTEMYMHFY